MGTKTESKTLTKALDLYDSLISKEDFHRKKWDRARKRETQKYHYDKMCAYSKHRFRCGTLLFSLRRNEKFGAAPHYLKLDGKRYTERKLKQKEEGRIKFESTYRVALWFYSESLTADYGTHHCDKCSRKYHHSPSSVFLGAKKVHHHACGYCVNSILRFNRQEEIYC